MSIEFLENIKKIAMIPARLGSKRVPRKNLRLLGGKPLIAYAILAALDAGVFDGVYVNSESDEIGRVGEAMGARWYRRDERFAGDHVKNEEFVRDFLEHVPCGYLFMVNPTSPFISSRDVAAFVQRMMEGGFDSFFAVEEIRSQVIFRGEAINFEVNGPHLSSQDIVPAEAIRWGITGWKTRSFLDAFREKGFATYCGKIGTYPLTGHATIDIDYEEDFWLAEAIMASMKGEERC